MTNTETATKLLPYIIDVNGSTSIVMGYDIEDAISRSDSAIERNRESDPKFYAEIFGKRTHTTHRSRSYLRTDLI